MNEVTTACFKALYQNRWLLLLVAVAALAFSAIRLLFFPPGSYYAEAVLVASTPKQHTEVKDLMPEAYSPKVYVDLVNSRTVLYETYQEALAQKVYPENEAPEFDEFANLLRASVSIIDQTTRPVNYSPLITLRAWSEKPELATTLVDIWAGKAMKAAQAANLMQYGQLSQTLEKQAGARKKNLDELWKALEEEKSQFDVASKKEELGLLLKEMDSLLIEKAASERTAAAAEARLAAVQQKLAAEKPFIELFRSPSDDAYWLSQSEKNRPVEGKGMVTQQINDVYITLRADETKAAADLAGAQAEIQKIQAQIDDLAQRQKTLLADIAKHEYAQQRLTVEEALATGIYKDVTTAQTLVAETAGLVNGATEGATYPVGLNRLSDLSPVKDDVMVKVGVLSYAPLALGFSILGIVAMVVGRRFLDRINK